MSSSNGGTGGPGDEHHNNQNSNKRISSSPILTLYQKSQLEAFFERCPHPNETQQDQLAKVLGLQLEQIKEWFQTKMTQTQIPQPEPKFPTLHTSLVPAPEQTCAENQAYQDGDDFLQDSDPMDDEIPNSPTRSEQDEADEMDKARMLGIANAASEELVKLMSTGEPLWTRSSNDGRLVLNHERYERMFPRGNDPNVFKTPDTCEESSKCSILVNTTAMKLVEVLLHAEEMTEFFPTIVQRAETIQDYEGGMEETRHGALLLMYVEMHVLSPLVSSRKYFFLRYCKQIHAGIWLITDVSIDSMGENLPHLPSWKLPSGCLIRQMPDGNSSMVMWIEHVEANDRPQTSLLYRDLVCRNSTYGAERWLLVLQRNSEKFNRHHEIMPREETEAIQIEGRRSLLKLSHRMIQSLCAILNMSSQPDITPFTESNNLGVKISLRKNSAPGHPQGIIAATVTSFRLPLNHHYVFHFLRDARRRTQWDVLFAGHPVYEVANVATGNYWGNRLSIIRVLSNPLQKLCV